MIPILTPEEMRAVDAAAPEPVEVLISRAGAALSRAALELLGGGYGRRVLVVAGKGNNGADGRDAAARLARRGVRVEVVAADEATTVASRSVDLVIDAAYGTGFRGTWDPPAVGDIPVLAVDIPSGVDATSGEADRALAAQRSVTFAALKPGLLLGRGRFLAGTVTVADIGLDATGARAQLVEDVDVATALVERPADAHKWHSALWVVAGSPGMTGAAHLVTRAAQRSGAGYVRLSTPGAALGEGAPTEAVVTSVDRRGWAGEVLAGAERFAAMVVGPGLGRDADTAKEVRALVAGTELPCVVDGDALAALGESPTGLSPTTVLTPHDGEYARLCGHAPGADRFEATRRLAAGSGATVLLKGPTTVVASPTGEVLVSTAGDARLATAGTGDVLSGVIGALLATGVAPALAAAIGAHLHGRAAGLGWRRALVAGDVVDLLPLAIEALEP